MRTALTLQEIATIDAEDKYNFNVFVSPANIKLAQDAMSLCSVKSIEKYKFEYNITDNLSFKKKGIYTFILEELEFHSAFKASYMLYIGKVEKTNSFRRRFYKYRNSIGQKDIAPNVMKLTNLWPENTFVYFFEIDDDREIVEVEKILIHKIKPHFNEEYFSEGTVSTTNLYLLAQQLAQKASQQAQNTSN